MKFARALPLVCFLLSFIADRGEAAGSFAIAVGDRTLAGQPLSAEARQLWEDQLASAVSQQQPRWSVVDDPAKAYWLLQVAALERPDIVYLVPLADAPPADDEALLMSPPKEAALAWLREQLGTIARSQNLVDLAEREANQTSPVQFEIELRRLADKRDTHGKPLEGTCPSLGDGDMIGLRIKNLGSQPIRVSVLFVDAKHQMHAMSPRTSDQTPIRLAAPGQPGDAAMPVRAGISAAAQGIERLVAIAVEENPRSTTDDLSFLADPNVLTARAHSPLQQYLSAAITGRDKPAQQQPLDAHAFRIVSWRTHSAAAEKVASDDDERGAFGIFRRGAAEDFKAEIVDEQGGAYHTVNRTQAVLGTYGKVTAANKLLGRLARFEHRGLVRDIERARRFATVNRRGQGAGKDFVSFMGGRQAWQIVDLSAALSLGRQEAVEFQMAGMRLDQSDVIRLLNADREALTYFDYLIRNGETPCVVIENIVLVNYALSSGTSIGGEGRAQTVLTADKIGGQLNHERTSHTQLTSPVVRCYQMHEVKLHGGQVMELSPIDP